MSVEESIPGPTRILLARSETPSTTLSKMSFSTYKPRSGAAALSVIEEDGAGRSGNGGIDIGIVQNDVGRFAAEFERDFFQVAGRGLHNQFADLGRSGEGDLVDVRMRGQALRRQSRRSPVTMLTTPSGIPAS